MAIGRVRLRFSGFILFISNIASFILGFIFIVLISRALDKHDLGLWFYIGSIITYFEFFIKVVPYWAVRDFARGREIVKTNVIASTMFSIPLTILFLSLSNFLPLSDRAISPIFFLASLFIPIYYTSQAINSILYVKYPHKIGWRTPLIDGLKIPLAWLLLPFGLEGVLTAVIIANAIYMLYGLHIIRKDFEEKFDIEWLNSRLKHSWLPLMQSGIGYVNSASDSFLVGTLLSPIQLSLYGIGTTISNAIRASSQLVLPFSMKVLAESSTSKKEVSSMMNFLTIFLIPMLIGGVMLSRNLYGIFGAEYAEGANILWILILSATITSYASIFSGIISGIEKIDYDREVTFKKLLKSKLIILNMVDYISTFILITISLITVPSLQITGAALSRLISSSVALCILAYLSLNFIDLKKFLSDLCKVIIACVPMSIYLYLASSAYPRAQTTILNIFIGATIYFVTLSAIDSESRRMVNVLMKELTRKMFTAIE